MSTVKKVSSLLVAFTVSNLLASCCSKSSSGGDSSSGGESSLISSPSPSSQLIVEDEIGSYTFGAWGKATEISCDDGISLAAGSIVDCRLKLTYASPPDVQIARIVFLDNDGHYDGSIGDLVSWKGRIE
jgi:hypothetical protein